jgi:hypothetical protein
VEDRYACMYVVYVCMYVKDAKYLFMSVSISVYGTCGICIAWLYVFVFICMYGEVVEVSVMAVLQVHRGQRRVQVQGVQHRLQAVPQDHHRAALWNPAGHPAAGPPRLTKSLPSAHYHSHTYTHTYIYIRIFIHTYIAKVPSGEGIFGYFAFAAKSRVIGMGTFPLTGDPSKVRYPTLTHPTP